MLETIDGKRITKVAHEREFKEVERQLGHQRCTEVRAELNRIVDERLPDKDTGQRTFGSSFLGCELTPWEHPLSHLYDVACELEGDGAGDERILYLFI